MINDPRDPSPPADSIPASRPPASTSPPAPRGKLRIYLGYAAGVGKTCAMLGDAHEARKAGMDVVAGYIEPHDRPETLSMIGDLEQLPLLCFDYKGVALREFDLDGALARHPQLMLVDELAHTNAQGCRHQKRYQDVEELLRAGIDVYTTLNVQHIESLHDIVASLSGISVRERIPDSVFDGADQVELVDIEPEDLIERLNKGKIYHEAQARRALENFFTRERLAALREIALRRMADQVVRAAREAAQIAGQAAEPPARAHDTPPIQAVSPFGDEHILVCLSASPSNARVVRAAARMADALHGPLTALFVETSRTPSLSEKDAATLRDNLRLAEQLGAHIATVCGDDVPGQIAEYARVARITKVVIGRSAHARRRFARHTLVDTLTELAPNLDIYIIPDTQPSRGGSSPSWSKPRFTLVDGAKALGLLIACTLIGLCFQNLGFSEANIITVYILGVLLCSLVTRSRLYGVLSSLMSVLIFNYFFTAPRFTLLAYDTGYPVTFAVTLAAALITSTLVKRIKAQARTSAQKAYRTEVLLETDRLLAQARDARAMLAQTARQIVKLLGRTVITYEGDGDSLLEPIIYPSDAREDSAGDARAGGDDHTNAGVRAGDKASLASSDADPLTRTDERAVAAWVYKNNKRAGATTNTLRAARCLYLAVRGEASVLAVVGIDMQGTPPLEAFEKSLLFAMLGECAMGLSRERLSGERERIALHAEQERLRANLLRAISHDLRTPLTSISGNASMLISRADALDDAQRKSLYTDIHDDALWLSDLVENLLSLTRLENGSIPLECQSELLGEVIAEALSHVHRGAGHAIETTCRDDLLMARMDPRLIAQVIVNLVDNAIAYTPQGSHIGVSARRDGALVRVEVSDDGPGVPDAAKPHLFDMFYTADNARGDGRRGLGLGLYLCRAIVTAHGGDIYVRDNTPAGAIFGFTLPAEEARSHE